MNINNYKASDIAHNLNISTRRVQQLVKIGILPAPIESQYNLACCIRNYEQYLQEKLARKNQGQSTSSYSNVITQKLRLLKAQELEIQAIKFYTKNFLVVILRWLAVILLLPLLADLYALYFVMR